MWDDIKTHFEEWWILYVWAGLVLICVVAGVVACDGNAECMDELSRTIQ